MTPRQKLLAKIKALLAKTVANGCTEGEAMTALGKARALMDEFEVTDTDLTFGGEEAKVNTQPHADPDGIRDTLATPVGAFCGCRAFGRGIERLAFAGLYSETVFAHWLLDTLEEFVQRELRNYLDRTPSPYRTRRMEIRGFIMGCAQRIAERLHALAQARRTPGTAMTVKKNELIEAVMRGIVLRQPFRIRAINLKAERAGARAADMATFDKPLNQGEGTRLIK